MTPITRLIETSAYVELKVNSRSTRRERLGMLLRRLAQRIDGRPTLAVDLLTVPVLSTQQRAACIRSGLDFMASSAMHEARAETLEAVMRGFIPQLYADRRD